MWATTFSIIRGNALAVVGFLAFDTLIDIFSRGAASYMDLLTIVSTALFTYYIYRAVLFGERFNLARLGRTAFRQQFAKFFWRSICLLLLLALITMIVSVSIFVVNGGPHIRENPTAFIAMVALFIVVVPVMYAWLGNLAACHGVWAGQFLRGGAIAGQDNIPACTSRPANTDSNRPDRERSARHGHSRTTSPGADAVSWCGR
jgi:hypothetical protein